MLLNVLTLGLNGRRASGSGLAGASVSIGSGAFTTGATLTASVNGGTPTAYQWQDDGVDIPGATASTYIAAIGTDGVADASSIRCVVTVDGSAVNSNSRQIRYAAGLAPSVADGQAWTVDDTAINIDGSASGANLTFSYAATGLPAGVSIDGGTGAITGGVSAVGSGTITVTATDQYGRTYQDTFTWSAALRSVATAASGLGPFSFTENAAISNQDLSADFTLNGNTLTYSITGTPLPAGLSLSTAGILSGTPTAVTASATYTVRGQDEYGRDVDSAFTLEVVAAGAGIAARMGANTQVGRGGIATTGTAISSGDPSGHFQVSGGLVTPTAAGNAASLNAGPYNLVMNDASQIDITIIADHLSVRGLGELTSLIPDEAAYDGKTIELRGDVAYGEINVFNGFNRADLPNGTTLTADRADPEPIEWLAFNGADVGNVAIDGLKFYQPTNNDNHHFIAPQNGSTSGRPELIKMFSGASNITIRNCELYSDMVGSKSGGLLVDYKSAITTAGDGHTIEDNEIHHIAQGINAIGSNLLVQRNDIHHIYNDFIRISGATDCNFLNNTLRDIIGFGKILHQDFFQFTGDATRCVIEGNVCFPGDFIAETMTAGGALGSAGDQVTENVDVAASLTLDEPTYNARVARATADVTITLPASPSLGDTYWFNGNGNVITLNANTGQTHGDGLLPRTINSSSNNSTFMVYWDGTEWQTKYGLRAGIMYLTAGTVTLTDRFLDRSVMIDATDGNVDITMPVVGVDAGGIAFQRIDATANTAVVRPNGADTFTYRGAGAATLDVTQDAAYGVRALGGAASGEWDAVSGLKGETQGVFGNGGAYTFDDIRVRGNILWSNASHGHRLEDDFPDEVVENNTYLRTFPADQNSDGVIDGNDGFFNNYGTTTAPGVRMRGDAAGDTDRRAMRNMNVGTYDFQDTALTEAFNFLNIGLAINTADAFPNVHFNGATPADYYPTTKAEAIAMARAKVGGPLDGTFIGAVGTTDENGFWNFTAGAINPAAPDSTVAAVPQGWDADWVSAATGLGGGNIDVTLDFECFSNPALTDIELEFDDSGVWESLGATARGTHTITKTASTAYTITGIRGVNAQGDGEETTLSIAVTSGAATGPTFANSQATNDYATAFWDPRGGTKTINAGWLEQPATAMRADTSAGGGFTSMPAAPAGETITVTVDVRQNGGSENVLLRPRNVTSGQNPAVSFNTGTQTVNVDTADDAGYEDLGGGVYRVWAKISTVGAGERLLVELPTSAAGSTDFQNPAVFYQDLTPTEIAALT